ncbi:molybdopterin-dependent oxidoreductase [Chloroflexota bacterium]
MVTTEQQVIKTACQICHAMCGINVHLDNGRIVKVEGMKEHPMNQGRLCPKAAGIIDLVYSPERLNYPMKKENGEWKQISWDEALDTIADKLEEVKEIYGSRALAMCYGMIFLIQERPVVELARRLTDIYGTPNVFSVDSMCFRLRMSAYTQTLGKYMVPDVEGAKCVIVWGTNPDASFPPVAWRLSKEKLQGRKLIVIDPRYTSVAKRAHIHIQPRPGTDTALALGMLNVIINEGLYDKEFVHNWTSGFEELAEHVKRYTPEDVEKITWVPAEKIREVARVYATTKPACIYQAWNALDQKSAGFQNARAIAILQAITGNFDVAGGSVSVPMVPYRFLRLLEKMEGIPLGIDRFPLHYQSFSLLFGEGQGMVLADTLLTGKPYPVKAMIVAGSNPLLTWPNTNKLKEALEKLDFLVVMDLFMTETAKMADMVLPAASFLERSGLINMYAVAALPYVMLRKQVVQVGECWSDLKFWLELGRRMGYEEHFPWKDEEELFDYLLEPANMTVKYLKEEKPEGLFYTDLKYKWYEKKGIRTPSGKIELYSIEMEKMGYAPLPVHGEPPESPISTPDLAREYPLILTTGARVLGNVHSQLRNIPRLRQKYPEPLVEIHPDSAAEYGIEEGELVVVETKRGYIEIKALVTKDILPGIVNIPHGWDEANVNMLTDEKPADTVVGNPALKALLCRIQKKHNLKQTEEKNGVKEAF